METAGLPFVFLRRSVQWAKGSIVLDGVPRMRQRPIAELVDVLRNLGTRGDYLGESGFPPVRLLADGLPGGVVKYGSAASSQFLSAVLMASPYARHEVRVDLEGGADQLALCLDDDATDARVRSDLGARARPIDRPTDADLRAD